MAYVFKQNLVAASKYSIKCPYSIKPEYVTIHDTANSAPASNEISYMISNNNQVSFHIAVDEKEAIQGLPFNRNSWSDGDGANGSGNRKGISLEICRPKNNDRSLYDQAEENAVYVAARLLFKFGLGIDRLRKHQDWSNKNCPNLILTENRWDGFKGRVQWVLDEIKKGTIEPELESGTTSPKTPSQSIKLLACERKAKAIVDVNIWDGIDYKNVVDHIKKDSILFFNEITEDGLFGKLGENRYISLNDELFLIWDLWKAPLGKIQILSSQINAWSGPAMILRWLIMSNDMKS